jgi:hypothetical protein
MPRSGTKNRALSDETNTQPPAKIQKQAAGESVNSNKEIPIPESPNATSTAKENDENNQEGGERKVSY